MKNINKIELAHLPTPLTFLENITREKGKGNLYMKRDDLTGLGGGGNKLRKLEYLAAEAKEQNCSVLMTVGGPQTNHGRITAAVAAKTGMKSVLLVTGTKPEKVTGNILLDGLFGSDYRLLDIDETALTHEEYNRALDRAAASIRCEYGEKGEKVYYIPLGGSNALGAMGYFFAVKEIMDQCEALEIRIDHLVASFGSGGTFGGLWMGARYFNAPFNVTGITVSPGLDGKLERLSGLMEKMNSTFELGIDLSGHPVDVFDKYKGEGYNVPDRKTRDTVAYLASREGLLIDPVYTGKGFSGCLDLMEKGKLQGNVMFLHTGVSPALHAPGHLEGFQSDLGTTYIREVR